MKITTISAAIGTQLPGIAFFLGTIPPELKAWTLLASGGAMAIFLRISLIDVPDEKLIGKGSRRIAAAILLAVLYGALFQFVTVGDPQHPDSKRRFQCGFGLLPFSLTPKALDLLHNGNLGINNKEDLMLAVGGFPGGQGSAAIAWKLWTILLSSGMLIALFVTIYIFWASGLAYFARVVGTKNILT
ncbi:MAG: hypothetical protein ABSD59_25300 [Terracidiphilus sp.]|jgi:hypothetical protein